jgi:UDP:flavonoid glycosyltransferase YjiC (YdhE family)
VFVSHGGLNSIREAVEEEVPLLICPGYNIFDGHINALMVEEMGIGKTGNMATTYEDELTRNINGLANDVQYKTNLKRLKESNLKYGKTKLLEAIRGLSSVH